MKMSKLIILFVCFSILSMGSSAIAGEYSSSHCVDKCWLKIKQIYPGSQYANPCRISDTEEGLFIVWNMACPFILADPITGPRRTGAACEVSTTTGEIIYLAVSARELIKIGNCIGCTNK